MFIDGCIQVVFEKQETLGKILSPNYNNSNSNNQQNGNFRCNAPNCETCDLMRGEMNDFMYNGKKYKINGKFNRKSTNVIYVKVESLTRMAYVGSAKDFSKRVSSNKSNTKNYDQQNGKIQGCALVSFIYQLETITGIDRMEILANCKTYIVDSITLSKIALDDEFLDENDIKYRNEHRLSKETLQKLNLPSNTLENKSTIDQKLVKKEIEWQLKMKLPWKGINDWRDVNTSNKHRRGFSTDKDNTISVEKEIKLKKAKKYQWVIQALANNTNKNDCGNFNTMNIIERWRQYKENQNGDNDSKNNDDTSEQHMPDKIKLNKQEWFEKIIQNNKLFKIEHKKIFFNISMKMKNVKNKKEFEKMIKEMGILKVKSMLQLMNVSELEIWLPSMINCQLEVLCKVLNIKQSGKKQEKLARIMKSIH